MTICVGLAVAFMAAQAVRADLATTPSLSSVNSFTVAAPAGNVAAVGRSASGTSSPLCRTKTGFLGMDVQMPLDLAKNTADGTGTQNVDHQLPPPPDSATLFMCALGSLGVFQAGRSVKKINLSFVPDWYHDGGPRQIGHAHALEMDLTLLASPLVVLFDQPLIEPNTKICCFASPEAPPLLTSQFSLQIEAPRGPPAVY